jgi:hypothetical protein
MEVGELAHIKTHSRFVDHSMEEGILEFEVELLETKSADTIDLNARLNQARETGNEKYKAAKYEKAYQLYKYGIHLLDDDFDVDDEEQQIRRYTLVSNAAACLLKVVFK